MNPTTATQSSQSTHELTDSLTRLETALLSPVVSGELESWAKTVAETTQQLAHCLPEFLDNVLHPQYALIAKADAELLSRVEQLVAEDKNMLHDLETFRSQADQFVARAAQVKKDEVQLAGHRQTLEQNGIELIVRVRRQRAAADTWMAEANYRDRGPVD